MLRRVDAISADIAVLDERITEQAAPLAGAVARLDEIPGISLASAYVILAEIGTDMTRFPTAGHLASWARLAPGIRQSAGKKKGKGSTGHGNAYLAAILGNAAAGAAKTDTFLGERYRRIARRRGSKRAIVAIGRSILVITWHLLSDPDARFYDLGPGYYAARIDPERRKHRHIRELEALGYTVTLKPAA
jgi:transposase